MEKSLRVLGGDEGGESHSHGHTHSHSHVNTSANAVASGVSITPPAANDGLRSRGGEKGSTSGQPEQVDPVQPGIGPSKLSAYLNLFGDFVHNMYDILNLNVSVPTLISSNRTDGLA